MINRRSAGRFRHRITITDPNTKQDASGHPVETPLPLWKKANIPAHVEDVGGGATLRDQQIEYTVTTIVECRYLAAVKPQYHVTFGSRRLNIERVQDVNGRQRYLRLFCRELAN